MDAIFYALQTRRFSISVSEKCVLFIKKMLPSGNRGYSSGNRTIGIIVSSYDLEVNIDKKIQHSSSRISSCILVRKIKHVPLVEIIPQRSLCYALGTVHFSTSSR